MTYINTVPPEDAKGRLWEMNLLKMIYNKIQINVFLLLILSGNVFAQNYLISFKTKNEKSMIDSVNIENLTQHTSLGFSGSDTLNLFREQEQFRADESERNAVYISPKPSEGICAINFEILLPDSVTIGLWDENGKKTVSARTKLNRGFFQYTINGLNPGNYLIKIFSKFFSYSGEIKSTYLTFNKTEISQLQTIPSIKKSELKKLVVIQNNHSFTKMPYKNGDLLKITGISGNNKTVVMRIPTKDKAVEFHFSDCTDIDGNHYAVMQIGNQLWTTDNLKTIRYRNGDTIPNITENDKWNKMTSGAFRNYYDIKKYVETYGRLYNWYAVNDQRGLAPKGWHIPDEKEWSRMQNAVMHNSADSLLTIGNQMKEAPLSTAGFCDPQGGFGNLGTEGYWWLSAENDKVTAWYTYLLYRQSSVSLTTCNKNHGFAVRCVKNLH